MEPREVRCSCGFLHLSITHFRDWGAEENGMVLTVVRRKKTVESKEDKSVARSLLSVCFNFTC